MRIEEELFKLECEHNWFFGDETKKALIEIFNKLLISYPKKDTIKQIIVEEFENSEHAVIEEENMIAIVKTDYTKMADKVAQRIVDFLQSEGIYEKNK